MKDVLSLQEQMAPKIAQSLNLKLSPKEWVRSLEAGEFKDQRAIAAATGLSPRYIRRIIRSALLAPEIVEAIVQGRQAPQLTLTSLIDEVPLSWAKQNARIAAVSKSQKGPAWGRMRHAGEVLHAQRRISKTGPQKISSEKNSPLGQDSGG
jgi:hypothetical protein